MPRSMPLPPRTRAPPPPCPPVGEWPGEPSGVDAVADSQRVPIAPSIASTWRGLRHLAGGGGGDVAGPAGVLVLADHLQHLRVDPRQDARQDVRHQPRDRRAAPPDAVHDPVHQHVHRGVGRPAQAEAQLLDRVVGQLGAVTGPPCRGAAEVVGARPGHQGAVEVEEGSTTLVHRVSVPSTTSRRRHRPAHGHPRLWVRRRWAAPSRRPGRSRAAAACAPVQVGAQRPGRRTRRRILAAVQ